MGSLSEGAANPSIVRPLVLVTRPREDAAGLVAALSKLDCDTLVEPLLAIEPEPVERDTVAVALDDCQAILVTSANGIRMLARVTERRDLPVLAVGAASAAAAEREGFNTVRSAGGDVVALASLIATETEKGRLDPTTGTLFHPAGSVVAGDLKGHLEVLGYQVTRIPMYQARKSERFSDECFSALNDGRIDLATFYSPRTAAHFAALVENGDLAQVCTTMDAVCLSQAVVEKLSELPLRTLYACASPTQDSLIDRIRSWKLENPK